MPHLNSPERLKLEQSLAFVSHPTPVSLPRWSNSEAPPAPRGTKLMVGLSSAILVYLALLLWSSTDSNAPDMALSHRKCDSAGLGLDPWAQHDPHSQPGYLDHNTVDEYQSEWRPFPPAQPAPNWILKIRRLNMCRITGDSCDVPDDLKPFINATILLIGDSVDRNTVSYTGDNVDARAVKAAYDDITNPEPQGWNDQGLARIVSVPALRLTIANCFHYGLDDSIDFKKQVDWHAPGLAEDRIEQLCAPLARQLEHPPTLIQLHSGMWDLALFGREDTRDNQTTETSLSAERMQWWQNRMTSLISTVKQTWPDVPIVTRILHRPDDPWSSNSWTSGQEHLGYTNYFSDIRVTQLRQMQIAISRREGLHVFDFGTIWEGFQRHQAGVHPDNQPGGMILGRALLHYLHLARTL